MEVITRKGIVDHKITPVYGDIIDYISISGKIFQKESECLNDEARYLAKEKMKSISIKSIDVDGTGVRCYFAKTQEDINFILTENYISLDYKVKYADCVVCDKLIPQPNEWMGIRYEDGGDSRDTYTIYSQTSLKKVVQEYIDSTKFLME